MIHPRNGHGRPDLRHDVLGDEEPGFVRVHGGREVLEDLARFGLVGPVVEAAADVVDQRCFFLAWVNG